MVSNLGKEVERALREEATKAIVKEVPTSMMGEAHEATAIKTSVTIKRVMGQSICYGGQP